MHIEIRIFQANHMLCFTVKDDGKGIPTQQLNQVRLDLKNKAFGEKSAHIGLRNLNQRLSYRYGKDAQLSVESDEQIGTTITLKISMNVLTGENNNV